MSDEEHSEAATNSLEIRWLFGGIAEFLNNEENSYSRWAIFLAAVPAQKGLICLRKKKEIFSLRIL